ncbi:hypothetical protein [Streptomyces sp. NPDC127114]|uniref:hypothetical protein n=1 Tax=Streptomyces sp. NPDC127114 TaxID=3345366 RepID=UPI00362FB054
MHEQVDSRPRRGGARRFVLSLGAVGLTAPSVVAATTAVSQPADDGPIGSDGCQTDPYNQDFSCTLYDVSTVAKPATDAGVDLTCNGTQGIVCSVDRN